ncbi:MAG: hypothetical protein U0703_24160 [Anaerolineae bacterium]
MFANLTQPIAATLTFGQEMAPGLLILLAISAGIGALVGLMLTLPGRWGRVIVLALGLTVVVGSARKPARRDHHAAGRAGAGAGVRARLCRRHALDRAELAHSPVDQRRARRGGRRGAGHSGEQRRSGRGRRAARRAGRSR